MKNYLEKIKAAYHGYQELHVHTEGSFRDGANTVADVFDAAEQFQRNAVAITDHGNWTRLFEALKERTKREKKVLKKELEKIGVNEAEQEAILKCFGPFDTVRNPNEKMVPWIEKYEKAFVDTAKKSIQFIPGIEMYQSIQNENGTATRHHLCLYAKNWDGIRALFALNNLAQLNKIKDYPCCTMESLQRFIGKGNLGHGNVVATSACIAGVIQSILLKPFRIDEEIKKLLEKLDRTNCIDPDILNQKKKDLNEIEEEIKVLHDWILMAKKHCSKKWSSAVSKAEKTLEKAEAKSMKEQLSFDEQPDNEAVLNAKKALDEARENFDRAQEYQSILNDKINEYNSLKESFKQQKSSLAALEKSNEPARKLKEKISSFEEQKAALGDVYEQAKSVAIRYNEIFGQGNFFLEIQDHGIPEELVVKNSFIRMSKETGIPLTVANDVHFKSPEFARKRAIVAALRYPSWTIQDIIGQQGNDQLYFKSNEEMKKLFSDIPQAIENTSRIAEMCNVFYKKELHFPNFEDTTWGLTPEEYLRKIAKDNIINRYPDYNEWNEDVKTSFQKRFEYELNIINKMGYASYIAIVQDFINFSKRQFSENSVGPGRGSGAGSLICYLIGITNVDPLRYGLIFERFLNPERVSLPDIDVDFATSIRDKVVGYVANRYAYKGNYWAGKELSGTTCNIYTEGTLAARSAIRQVGKVTGVSLAVCDQIAKLIPAVPKMTLKKALNEEPALKELYDTDTQIKCLVDDAILVEGIPVQTGIHAAGVIIADKPVNEYAPMFYNIDTNCWVIQFDMVSCEADAGLIKMDFLALKNLDILLRASRFIAATQKKAINFKVVNKADDANVIDSIYAHGKTNGVFQFESGGMKQTLKSFIPHSIDDIILLNAAYRPGPMQYIPQVTDVKFNRKEAEYIVPEMAAILDVTYGSPIYQEQIQQIFHNIAGFSLGQADIIRRAMSKKHLDELEAAKDGFFKGFFKKGAKKEDIEAFWTQLLDFANYAFNKSHAAAYSILSYYTAYVKHYFPVEYMASLLSYSSNEDLTLYSKELKDLGIKLLGPDVNKSVVYTAPNANGQIRYGLMHIKGVASAANKIVEERKKKIFTSYKDFIVRCVVAGISKTAVEGLIKSGALDSLLEVSRQTALMSVAEELKACRNSFKKAEFNNDDEACAFLMNPENFTLPKPTIIPEFSNEEILKLEKEVTGIYVSGHPLTKYEDIIGQQNTSKIADIEPVKNQEVSLTGYISSYRKMKTKKDNKEMCSFVLEDETGEVEVIVSAFAYKKFSSQFCEGGIVTITGKLSVETNDEGDVVSFKVFVQKGKRLA